MKNALKHVLLLIGKLVAALAFDRQYLRGRHFGPQGKGWRWVLKGVVWQKLFGFNRHIPWPTAPFMRITSGSNLTFHPDDLNNFQSFGCYYQNARARIVIGRGTYIAPNVGIITENHDPTDPSRHSSPQDVIIGEACWIGMNAVILPGVVLGPRTTVAAGAVVTRSFESGHCIVGGVPARVLRQWSATDNSGEPIDVSPPQQYA